MTAAEREREGRQLQTWRERGGGGGGVHTCLYENISIRKAGWGGKRECIGGGEGRVEGWRGRR